MESAEPLRPLEFITLVDRSLYCHCPLVSVRVASIVPEPDKDGGNVAKYPELIKQENRTACGGQSVNLSSGPTIAIRDTYIVGLDIFFLPETSMATH